MKGSKKPGVMLYFELYTMLKQMTVEDAHALIMAIFEYAQNGIVPQFSSQALVYVWEFVRLNIDRDDQRYLKVVEQKRKAAEKRWSKQAPARDSAEDTFAALACK